MSGSNEVLPNSDLAELLAREAIHGRQPLQRALHRAARRAFLWPEEAAQLIREHRSLTELPGVGPYLSKLIRGWLEAPARIEKPPQMRKNFLTIAEARALLARNTAWSREA